MPNGGVPLHMVMTLSNEVSLHLEGPSVSIRKDGKTIASLTPEESRALASFLLYWTPGMDLTPPPEIGDPLSGRKLPNVLYDY